MSNHWWRAYDDAVDNAKLLLLSDKQHRAWFNLMSVTSANDGRLPEIKVVAVKLRITEAKAQAIVAELIEAKLFDRGEDGAIAPHNWTRRQYKSDVTDPTNAARQKRYRDRHRVTENNVTPKLPETEYRGSEPKGSGASAPPDPKADYFRRGRQVCGPSSGGLLSKLLKSQGNEDDPKAIAKARARIEDASTKAKPAEWLGRVMNGAGAPENDFYTNPTAGSLI